VSEGCDRYGAHGDDHFDDVHEAGNIRAGDADRSQEGEKGAEKSDGE
jgi:hypothetical protein